jgi:phosphate transport system substrate-binding protein
MLSIYARERTENKRLSFDNPNSSTVRYINDLAGVKNPYEGCFFKTNEDVIKYVSENEGWLELSASIGSQPSTDCLAI